MKLTKLLCFAAFAMTLAAQNTQGTLTNMRVANLVRSGVSTPEILRIIGSAPQVSFDLRPGSTDNLLKAGVSEDVIKAMAARESGSSTTTAAPAKAAAALATPPSGKLRVFVEDSNDSWSFSASRHFGQGSTHPQTVEVMKTFGESCPNLIVTDRPDKADYVVRFERESMKGLRKHNKFAAFNKDGDMVYSASTRALGNAVRGFCSSLRQNGFQKSYLP